MEGEVDSVSTTMIVDSSVTSNKIADVDPVKISPQGVGSGLDADTVDGVDASSLEESAEIDADILSHAGDSAAHHARYTDAEAISAVQSSQQGFLIGEIRIWGGPLTAIPAGWLVCDGSEVSRGGATAGLFAVYGTIHGPGNGSTTFNLPDFRDRSPMGARQDDAGVPKSAVTGGLTQFGGSATHVMTVSELPPHDHDITHTHDVIGVAGIGLAGPNIGLGAMGTIQTSGPSVQFSGMTGSGDPIPILDPFLAVHFIVFAGN